jgi:hypothetical protein
MAFPDSKVGWIPGAYRQVKRLLRHHSFDLIYSFGYPWSSHVVASVVQRQARIPWVADYADPWSLNPDVHTFPRWRKQLDIWLESRLLRRTSSVVVATPEAQAFTGSLFGPAVERRTHVARVAQFYSDEYKSPSGRLPEHFQIAFTGLMDSLRQPYPFLDAARVFGQQRDVQICLAGLISENFRNYSCSLGLEPLIRHLGRMQRKETIELQKTSHVLLSFGWPGGLQVPCKIYEYFAARRPLLHVEGDARDPASTLVRKYRRGLVVPNDAQDIRDGLQTLYGLWIDGKLEEQFDLSQLDEFCLPRSLDGLEDAIDAVMSRAGQTGPSSTSNPAVAQVQSVI